MRVVKAIAILFVAATALPVLSHAESLSSEPAKVAIETRVALVIGNSAYKDSPLANPVNDATDMAKALGERGFKVILRRNANIRDMRQAIREFGNELRRAQVGLFYFAGHGIQLKGNNFLVPVGADIQNEADAEDLSVDANFVLRTMEDAQVQVSIVILDACRNNPFARSFRSSARGLAQMSAATGSLVAFATAPGSVAADGTGRNGIYTKHLLASLNERDTDILKVFQRTRAGVVRETGGRQTPWESTSLIGDFFFRPTIGGAQVASPTTSSTVSIPVPADPAASDRAFWESIKDSRNADEMRTYLEQYPNGLFVALARTRLKAAAAKVPPSACIPLKDKPMVKLTTSLGAITIALDKEKAPISSANFVKYVENGHYDGTIFHRVIGNFMIQGGGFTKDMQQKPTMAPIQNEAKNGLKNDLYTLAMARTPDPHSASSQFFINIKNNDFLNYPGQDGWGYAVFGKVIEGMDVVDKIKVVPVGNKGGHQNVPTDPVFIEKAECV